MFDKILYRDKEIQVVSCGDSIIDTPQAKRLWHSFPKKSKSVGLVISESLASNTLRTLRQSVTWLLCTGQVRRNTDVLFLISRDCIPDGNNSPIKVAETIERRCPAGYILYDETGERSSLIPPRSFARNSRGHIEYRGEWSQFPRDTLIAIGEARIHQEMRRFLLALLSDVGAVAALAIQDLGENDSAYQRIAEWTSILCGGRIECPFTRNEFDDFAAYMCNRSRGHGNVDYTDDEFIRISAKNIDLPDAIGIPEIDERIRKISDAKIVANLCFASASERVARFGLPLRFTHVVVTDDKAPMIDAKVMRSLFESLGVYDDLNAYLDHGVPIADLVELRNGRPR